jgi:hypothetical protein
MIPAKIRFEVAARKTYYWPFFLQRAKKHGRHRVEKSDGLELHIVDVEDMEGAVEVWQCTRSWKAVSYYVSGKAVPQAKFNHIMNQFVFRDVHAKWMLEDIIKTASAKKAREDDDKRWRMGLGPEPE